MFQKINEHVLVISLYMIIVGSVLSVSVSVVLVIYNWESDLSVLL